LNVQIHLQKVKSNFFLHNDCNNVTGFSGIRRLYQARMYSMKGAFHINALNAS